MYNHFENLSCFYNELRTTDLEPIMFICEKLQNRGNLKGADIGCGGGRYDLLLLKHLPELQLICGDVNEAMIRETACYLENYGQKNFSAYCLDASDLKLPKGALDFVATFNAIHHFEPVVFLNLAGRALKDTTRSLSCSAAAWRGGGWPARFCSWGPRAWASGRLR